MAKSTRYTATEIADAGRIATRTLTYWHDLGLMPRPKRGGSRGAYGPEDLVRVQVVSMLRDQKLSTDEIRDRTRGKTLAELEAVLRPPPPQQPSSARAHEAPTYPASRWERIEVVKGLEIHIDVAGGQALRLLAQHMYAHYGPMAAPA